MPIQGKFKYEFQKGSPWQHENLIAPFDFAILKTDQELKIERDSILANIKPYFSHNNEIGPQQIELFNTSFDSRYKEASLIVNKLYPKFVFNDSIYNFCKSQSLEILKFIYEKGVVDFTEILENTKKGTTLVLVKDNIAENREIDEVFTQKIAYSFITKKLKKELTYSPELVALIENIKIYDFVVQDLFYDKITTNRIKEDLFENIPTKRGMIQTGERIISRGDIIHDESYRILESLRKEYENLLGSNLYSYHSCFYICFYSVLEKKFW
jgi:hypothetical protein